MIILDKVKTVLVVDDEPDILRLVETVLTRAGHKVVTASNGERAIEKVRKMSSAPDLLLTDVQMPGMNGMETATAALEIAPDLPILFVTGYAHNAAIGSGGALEPGMEILTKPFAMTALADKIRSIVS